MSLQHWVVKDNRTQEQFQAANGNLLGFNRTYIILCNNEYWNVELTRHKLDGTLGGLYHTTEYDICQECSNLQKELLELFPDNTTSQFPNNSSEAILTLRNNFPGFQNIQDFLAKMKEARSGH